MRRLLQVGAGAVAAFAVCLLASAVLGSTAAGWLVAACLVIVTCAVAAAMRAPLLTVVPEPHRGRVLSAAAYPRYERLRTMLRHGMDDRRYFDRVVAPLLRDTAEGLQLPREALRDTVGEQLWPLVDPSREPSTGTRDGPAPPRPSDVAALLASFEHIESS